jgi:hypothetical protein
MPCRPKRSLSLASGLVIRKKRPDNGRFFHTGTCTYLPVWGGSPLLEAAAPVEDPEEPEVEESLLLWDFLAFFSVSVAEELPDVSPAADGVEDMLPLAPGLALEEPEEPDEPEAPDEPEELPASLPVPLCDFMVDDGDDVLLSVAELLCANAREDSDATASNESERRMFFNVMSNSLNKKDY